MNPTPSLVLRNTMQLAAGIGLLCLSCVQAQAEDLLSVYRLAENRDPVIDAARYALQASEQKVPQARAGLLPVIAINSSTGRQDGRVSFSDGPPVDRGVRSWSNTLQLSQPVFRWGSWVAYEQADAQVRQAMAQYAQSRQELVLRVAQAYFDVLVGQESVYVSTAQLAAVDQQLSLAKRNFEVGTSTITDVHEATSRFDLARAQKIAAVNDLDAKYAELDRIIGATHGQLAVLRKDVLPARPEPADVAPWMDRAGEQYPLVLVQRAAQEAAEREVTKQDAGHLPTLDLTASYGGNFASGSISSPADISTRVNSRQVGLQLSIPIFSGGGVTSRAREAVANLGRATAELEQARRQATTVARQAFSGVINGLAQIDALASAVRSSQSSVDSNKIGYKIGTRINVDVLNAEQQLFSAQRDLSKARVDTLMQGLRLKASAGLLGADDLAEMNLLLVPPTPDR
jgi:outer membrane protein